MELLLALGITVIITGIVASTMYTAFRAKASAEAALKKAQEVDPISEMMARDFANAVPPTGVFAGQFLSDAANLSFYAAGGDTRSAVPGDIHQVEYFISQDPNTPANTLVRRVTTNLTPADGNTTPPEELICRNVTEFTLSYFDGTNWNDTWDSTAHQDASGLDTGPVAVMVSFKMGATPDTTQKISRIFSLPCAQPVNVGGMTGGGM